MALIEIQWDPSPRQVRQFALFWLSGFCFLWAAAAVAVWGPAMPAALLAGCGLLSVLLGLVRPSWMRVVYIVWMAAAFPISWLLAHVLFAGLYYGVVTPIGLVLRMFGYDPLKRRFDATAETYWVARRQRVEPEDYFRRY